MSDMSDYLSSTLQAADELYFNPQLAVPVAQQSQGDPQAAQAAAHASNMRTTANAKKNAGGGGWFDSVGSFFGHLGSVLTAGPGTQPKKINVVPPGTPGARFDKASGRWYTTEGTQQLAGSQGVAEPAVQSISKLNAPLAEVQHQYRTIRDVQDRHGTVAGLIFGGAIAGGATAGELLGSKVGAGRQGATLGGEAVAGTLGRTVFADSWDRTANGEAYKDSSGQVVSPGRDVARLLGHVPVVNSIPHGLLSGISDGVFDLAADPVAQGLSGIKNSPLGSSMNLALPTDVDKAAATIRGRQAFEDIAKRPAEQIAQMYPSFAPLAKELGAASTGVEVAQVVKESLASPVFKSSVTVPSWLDHLKTMSAPVHDVTTLDDLSQIGHLKSLGRKFTTMSPMSFDPAELKFTRELALESNTAESFNAVRSLLKMGRVPDNVVNSLVNDYINAGSAGERLKIIRGGMESALFSTGIADNQAVRQKIRADLTDQLGGLGMGKDGHYGFGVDGKPLSQVTLPDGSVTSAALFDGQTGSISMPSYSQFQSAARFLKASSGPVGYVTSKLGGVDDFLADHITSRVRQMLLINPATGMRLGLSEMFPNVLRKGVADSLQAEAIVRAAKAGYKASAEDANAILGARANLLGSVESAVTPGDTVLANAVVDGKNVALDRGWLADQLTLNHSTADHVGIVPPSMDGGHFHPNDAIGQAEATNTNMWKLRQQGPPRFREGDTFGPVGSGDTRTAEGFPLYWQRALREAANDEGMQKAASAYLDVARNGGSMADATRAAVDADIEHLHSIPEMQLSKFLRARIPADDLNPDPIANLAAQRVEAMRGLTHSPAWDKIGAQDYAFVKGEAAPAELPTEAPHVQVLKNLANGQTTDIEALKSIDPVNRPVTVKGRVLEPNLNGNIIDRLSNGAWKHVLGPTINVLARNRLYYQEVEDQFSKIAPRIEAGLLSPEDAVQVAEKHAVPEMAKFIHNPEMRTQMHSVVQNFIPFYFAQEQAIRRYGRLLVDDPAAFRRLQLMQTGLATYTQQVKDKTGTPYVVLPGAGFLSNLAVQGLGAVGVPVTGNVPTSVDGSVTSLNTIFPLQGLIGGAGTDTGGDYSEGLRPNFSPLVTLAAKALDKLHPAATPLTTAIIGPAAASQSIWSTLVPNTTLRNLMNSVGSLPGFTDQYRSTQIATFQALAHQQETSDAAWRKAGKSMTDPNRPKFVPDENASPAERQQFVDRINNGTHIRLIFKALLGAVSPLAPSVQIGDAQLQKEYSDALKQDGYPQGIENFLKAHPDAVSYTIGKSDAGKGASVPPYQLAESFYNSNKALFDKYPDIAAFFVPQDTSGKFDIGVYNEQLAQGLRHRKDLSKFMNDFYIAKGNHQFFNVDEPVHAANLAKVADDKEATKAENANWTSYLQNVMAKQHPVWYDNFTSQDRVNERQNQLDQLYQVFKSNDAPKGPMADGIAKLLKGWNQHVYNLASGSASHWTADEKQNEAYGWQSYLAGVSKKAPYMSVVINAVFRSLKPTTTELRAAA